MPLPQLLVGKVAAITGGLTGIGRAIALEYLRHGAKVAINHLGGPKEEPLLEALQKDVSEITGANANSFIAVPGDVTQPDTGRDFVAKTVAAFGRLDIFVSNAGVCKFAEFLEFVILYPPYPSLSLMLSEAGCDPLLKVRVYGVPRFANISISICRVDPPLLGHTINTNLSGAFYATQAAGRQMALEQSPPGGSIIGISSISALVGGGQQTHYTPTKAGVLSLMQSCAVALGKYNIRCNALLPGTIRTQLNDEDMSDPVKREYMEGRIPLGRLGQPPDLAGPAVFLACEELSSYVTGAQLLVDGGAFVNLQ
ncbi:alcohol dehydrogenase [Aspergillus arachidicola]|uniref:Alcohol dehydrogenase n=1 Tax=Aspergillus arachidicola TaxID=656916 RepID=A0A2G7FWA3_9EURO|nr:alcohol dehydrogenase [Aspergillus arachidicola]